MHAARRDDDLVPGIAMERRWKAGGLDGDPHREIEQRDAAKVTARDIQSFSSSANSTLPSDTSRATTRQEMTLTPSPPSVLASMIRLARSDCRGSPLTHQTHS